MAGHNIMATTLLKEVLGVKQVLGDPLDQAPSFSEIVEELASEYQHMTNEANNTAEAWAVKEYTLTTVAGTADYRLDLVIPTLYKPLAIYTIPADVNSTPQYQLQSIEFEYLPKEWAWLGQNRGQALFSSHDSQYIAFYRTIGTTTGEEIYARLAPVPTRAQSYRIIYQQTDWWDILSGAMLSGDAPLPNSSQRIYIRALAAENLLLKGSVMWSHDPVQNFARTKMVAEGLKIRKERYYSSYKEYLSSLDQPDVITVDSWADEMVWQ